MPLEQRIDRRLSAILALTALAPFLPAAWEFVQQGVPDVLFTGDGAALELRVLRAARGVQFLGPYSLFGWSHPGPAYFYLALPLYELFGERGPALNLFALVVNSVTAIALVLTAQRLLGFATAIAAAALVSVFVSLGAPFVATNEWNPIIPMLPLALLTFLAGPVALGESTGLPVVAFLASAIVQTHVGYGAPIAALAVVVMVMRRRAERQPVSRTTRLATAAVLAVCWVLPLYEAATTRPGNIQWLIEFFAPDNLAKQTWTVAWAALREQAAVMPLAMFRAIGIAITAPAAQSLIFQFQCALLYVVILTSVRNGDRLIAVLAAIPLSQWVVAIFAVRAIRQPMEFYLVAWISAIGLVAWIAFAAWMIRIVERRFGRPARLMLGFVAVGLMALAAITGPARPAVFREPDAATETLAREVELFVRANQIERPLVRIETRDSWPTAVAVVLHLTKRGVPLYVEDQWLYIVGSPFGAPPGTHRELRFARRTSIEQLPADAIVSRAAGRDDLVVYLAR